MSNTTVYGSFAVARRANAILARRGADWRVTRYIIERRVTPTSTVLVGMRPANCCAAAWFGSSATRAALCEIRRGRYTVASVLATLTPGAGKLREERARRRKRPFGLIERAQLMLSMRRLATQLARQLISAARDGHRPRLCGTALVSTWLLDKRDVVVPRHWEGVHLPSYGLGDVVMDMVRETIIRTCGPAAIQPAAFGFRVVAAGDQDVREALAAPPPR